MRRTLSCINASRTEPSRCVPPTTNKSIAAASAPFTLRRSEAQRYGHQQRSAWRCEKLAAIGPRRQESLWLRRSPRWMSVVAPSAVHCKHLMVGGLLVKRIIKVMMLNARWPGFDGDLLGWRARNSTRCHGPVPKHPGCSTQLLLKMKAVSSPLPSAPAAPWTRCCSQPDFRFGDHG
jgi:hypothetical protein